MPNPDSANRYTTTAIALHWLIAAGVIAQIALGWWMQSIPKEPPGSRLAAFNLHKSIGISIFLLMLARVAWRATHRPPALPPMPLWQARAARINHALLYACLVIMPLAGFTASSFSGRPIVYFGNPLPLWFAKNEAVSTVFYAIHLVTSCVLVAAIGVHVLAALKHQLVDRDGLMRRIWPWRFSHARAPVELRE